MTLNKPHPSLLSVHSRVSSGEVGNSMVESVFAHHAPLVRLYTVDTVQWTGPGNHPRKTGPTLSGDQLKAMVRVIMDSEANQGGGVRNLLLGYLPEVDQIEAMAEVIEEFQPDNLFLDPIIGDYGRLYIKEDTAKAIRELLLPKADFLFPNVTEARWLATGGAAPRSNFTLADVAPYAATILSSSTRNQQLVVTSVEGPNKTLGHVLFADGGQEVSSLFSDLLPLRISGTGDMMTGYSLAEFLSTGAGMAEATKLAHERVNAALRAMMKNDGRGMLSRY